MMVQEQGCPQHAALGDVCIGVDLGKSERQDRAACNNQDTVSEQRFFEKQQLRYPFRSKSANRTAFIILYFYRFVKTHSLGIKYTE